jgi:hypothetical protein
VALLSHVHSDHIGDANLNQEPSSPNARCDPGFPTVPVVPNSNLEEIIGAKGAAFVGTGGDATFLATRIHGLMGICGGIRFRRHRLWCSLQVLASVRCFSAAKGP